MLTIARKSVIYSYSYFFPFSQCRGSSVVERKPEELGVVGSIPTPGTSLRQRLRLGKPTSLKDW
jgi:hypothetical protein